MYGPDHPAYEGLKTNRSDPAVRRAWAFEMAKVYAEMAEEAHHKQDWLSKWYAIAKCAVFTALTDGEHQAESRAFVLVMEFAVKNNHPREVWQEVGRYFRYSEIGQWIPSLVNGDFEDILGI